MKHPRLALRRFSLLAPVMLLGAALLIRARLPRPQTEGDKWLWERAETADRVRVWPDRSLIGASSGPLFYIVSDRQSIRALLRAFQGTPLPRWQALQYSAVCGLTLQRRGHKTQSVWLVRTPQGYGLYWYNTHTFALTDAASVKRFTQALRTVEARTARHQPGYDLLTPDKSLSSLFPRS